MSDHERGAYTPPTDAPLSFDPRQPERGARPIPFTLVLTVLVLAAVVAAIFVFYQQGVRKAGEAPRTVGQPVGAMTTAAPPEAQPQDPAAGLQVYQAESGQPMEVGQPKFAPPPEQPQARPTTPVVTTAAPPAKATTTAQTAEALRPAIPAAAPPPAAKAEAPAPKAAPVAKAEAPAPAPAKPAPAKPAAGGAVVQIGALSSTALADRAWSDAVAIAPGLAAGKGKSIEKIEKNGGSLYRTAVTGFASRADAQAFCDKLKAAGKACFVR
ncbi:MAG: SPOR domain-containing protein [Phenylobacterium sp.]|uniref:cell division protein FtsN n=1 Tax=Phenylobacterium sp. TaxID=1871053 RepID=UPI0026004B66|nr:SPOR domain-containing protein [Phenylobacterium sp.]MBI1196641.1 SPOR domain-containing protein [Phenylobacterium sp.]